MAEQQKRISFAEKVWVTFRSIDVSTSVEQKKTSKVTLSYLSWATAWQFVMNHFPESSFKFDEPKLFDTQTGEQWVTVTIKEGENELQRRWWLPYLNYANAPVENPNAMQINNTRMRVLVKCLAMLGLGTELYTGEDTPDKERDKAPTRGSNSVMGTVLDDIELSDEEWTKARQHKTVINAAFFESDDKKLLSVIDELSKNSDMKLGVWSLLDSKVRAHIRKLTAARKEQ